MSKFRVSFCLLLCATLWPQTVHPGPDHRKLAQIALNDDDGYAPHLVKQAYSKQGPIVAVDEGHRNLRLNKGFVRLLAADGYRVQHVKGHFSYDDLIKTNVLVIMNPGMMSSQQPLDNPGPLFTEEEAATLHDWVAGGGSLLIASHNEASVVSRRFGVEFYPDAVVDAALHQPSTREHVNSNVFSGEKSLLSSHAIMTGRSEAEQVRAVDADTFGALQKIPENAAPLLRCSEKAKVYQHEPMQDKEVEAARRALAANPQGGFTSIAVPSPLPRPIPNAPVAVAFTFGKGRVVMLGSGMVLSSLLVGEVVDGKHPTAKIGLTQADNQQFTLNIMHWLSGLLDPK